MTIHPETEIISTSFDAVKHTHSYTIERNGKRFTVEIPDADFAQFGPVMGASAATNRMNRRRHLAMRLQAAIDGGVADE